MLSMKSKYAIRALMVLAEHENKWRYRQKRSPRRRMRRMKFLETILLELKNDGFVESKRGIFGGYFLSRARRQDHSGGRRHPPHRRHAGADSLRVGDLPTRNAKIASE